MKTKSYPQQKQDPKLSTDNLFLYIDGKKRIDELKWVQGNTIIQENNRTIIDPLNFEKETLEEELKKIRTKTVKNKIYYYKWENDKWNYCGKSDPSININKKILKINEKLKENKILIQRKLKRKNNSINKTIIKDFNNHIITNKIIDNQKYFIKLSDLVNCFEILTDKKD